MALTKISRGLLDTGVSDSSDATAITIDSSERVGINQSSPAVRLHVLDNGAEIARFEGNDEYAYIGLRGTVGGSATSLGYFGFANDTSTAADLNITNAQNGDISFTANSAERMRITSTGYVGINTTSPAAQLGFSGSNYQNGTEDGPSIRWNDSGTADAIVQTWINGSNGMGMLAGANTYIASNGGSAKFDTSKGSAAFIADGANTKASVYLAPSTLTAPVECITIQGLDSTADGCAVGINQTNPSNFAYFVIRPLATSGTAFQLHNQANARRWFYIVDGYYGYQGSEQIYSNGGVNRYFGNASGTAVGSIVVNSGSTAFNTTSDYRLKDNPQPLTGSGDFIDGLQPKTWTWNHGDGGTGVGFIAHEAAEVGLGLCVSGEKDAESLDKILNEETGEYEEQTTPTYQQLDYSSGELIANIVAELQALRTRVATLETELDAAEARITTLENA